MHAVVRTDASAEIGTGHLKRCLSLAEAFADAGLGTVTLVTRRIDDVSAGILADTDRVVVRWLDEPTGEPPSPTADEPIHQRWARVGWNRDAMETVAAMRGEPVDWLIIDHYAFDSRWHDAIRSGLGCRLLALDDLADRSLSPDLLVDPNPDAEDGGKYARRLEHDTRQLAGTRFAVLSRAYREAPPYEFRESVTSVGVFMGGTDPGNVSARVLRACREVAGFKGLIEIAATSANPNIGTLRAACNRDPDTRLSIDRPDLSGFFARHDIQIGAGGGATWERCCMGSPSILMAFAANQQETVQHLAEQEIVRSADYRSMESIGSALRSLIDDPEARAQMAARSRELVDGWGGLRVALSMSGERMSLRRATGQDAAPVFPWRNAAVTRRHFFNPEPIEYDSHLRWWSESLTMSNRRLMIAEVGTLAVGVIRFDIKDDEAEISLYVNPRYTGLGLGVHMLKSGQRWISAECAEVRALTARVAVENEKSSAAFASAGFTHVDAERWRLEIAR